jgi:hypothetical protein
VYGQRHEGGVGPVVAETFGGRVAAMGATVVDDPEHSAGRRVLAAALFEEALATFAGDGLASVGGDGHQL